MSNLVELDIDHDYNREGQWRNPSFSHKHVRKALPYFKSTQANTVFVHKIKSAVHHFWKSEYMWTSVRFECGNGGFMHKGTMYAKVPRYAPFCCRCHKMSGPPVREKR